MKSDNSQFAEIEEEARNVIESRKGIKATLVAVIEARAEYEFVDRIKNSSLSGLRYHAIDYEIRLSSRMLEKMIFVPDALVKRDKQLKRKDEINGLKLFGIAPVFLDHNLNIIVLSK